MLNRHIGFYGEAPRQTAADGGFASRHNLGEAKALGVRDVAFHKKAGLRVTEMVKSNWVIASCATSEPASNRHLVLEARLWSGALHLARPGPLQGIRLVVSRRLQSCFLPGSSQADRSTPSSIKLSLDRPELGSNPHRSPPSAPLITAFEPTRKRIPSVPSRDLQERPSQNKTIVYGRALASATSTNAEAFEII